MRTAGGDNAGTLRCPSRSYRRARGRVTKMRRAEGAGVPATNYKMTQDGEPTRDAPAQPRVRYGAPCSLAGTLMVTMSGAMRSRVVLDTSAVRSVVQGDVSAARWLELAGHRSRFHFAIFDTTLGELFAQLQHGQLPWSQWSANRGLVASVVDGASPLFLRIDDPDWRDRVTDDEREDERHDGVTLWRALMRAQYFDEIYDFVVADRRGRRLGQVAHEDGRAILDRHVAHHVEVIGEGISRARQGGGRINQDELAAGLLSALPGWGAGAQTWMRHAGRMIASGARPRDGYDPRSPNRRGDAIDIKLTLALLLPAYIISEDKRLARNTVAAKINGADRILTIEEFVSRASDLPSLT